MGRQPRTGKYKEMIHMLESEFNDMVKIINFRTSDGSKDNLDLIQKYWNLFVADNRICRTCPSQLASIISILKLRFDIVYNDLYRKYVRPTCKMCNQPFDKQHHFEVNCDECKIKLNPNKAFKINNNKKNKNNK